MNDISSKRFGVTWAALLGLALLFASAAKASPPTGATQSLTLAWNLSTNSAITNYNVMYGVASGVYTNTVTAGDTNTAIVTGLTPGTTYYLATVAQGSSGADSTYSTEVNYLVPPLSCSISLVNLNQIYSGTAEQVVVSTDPAGLAVNVTYNGSPTPPVNAGSYTVIATVFSATYTGATTNTLTISPAPSIISFAPIANQIVTNPPFALSATSSSTLPVQFTVLSGPATINGNVLTLTGAGMVTVEAMQAGNSNWDPAASVEQSFYVNPASIPATTPVITAQPDNQSVAGGEATFTVAASGAMPMSYQWYFDGTNICGATNSSLTLTGGLLFQVGNYSVLVSNSYGSMLSSNAVLGAPPGITTQPASQSVETNCNATFDVTASGAAPLSYQWWNNEQALAAQTNSSLVISNVQGSNFNSYSVVITNIFGAITSSVAVLAPAAPPVANPQTVLRFQSGGLRLNISELITNDTVALYDELTVMGVSSNSAAGGTVSLNGSWIYYAPPAGWNASDSFTYTVSDGHCGTAVGTVTVQPGAINPQPLHFGIAKMGDGSLQLSFDGMPGGTYQIQFTESLSAPNWQPLTNQTANSFGVFQFTDWPMTSAQGRFYRAFVP